ncbi:ABC transporter permease [Salirhabdus salicampi]|uniref:ABC transporter permease n=1 Tax=Salirhabdus salicampi TaxID=476102 RepID=UPI0020C3EDB9|nr:ABC transporter permease [Salirhabdus salicampi]MCP8615514.1 ABC transporter permease [Salirhabdus salicampi]
MFNANELWKKRLTSHVKELGRYMRLMFNDHLAFALLFFVAASAYYYQQWIQTLPRTFPVEWIMAITLGILLTHSPVRTLLKEADTVFLLPAEHKLKPYFNKSLVYSISIQMYWLVLVVAAVAPLYLSVTNQHAVWLLYLLIVLFVFKAWNILASWWMLKQRDRQSHFFDVLVRLLLNIFTIFFFLQGNAYLYATITTVMFVGILLFNYMTTAKKGLAWDVLIEKDMARMQSFYRLANLFTDVPHLKQRVKKRRFLVRFLVSLVPFKHEGTYDYLYRITFARSSDYLGMYVRLFLLAAFFIFWIPSVWFKLVFALLFIYLSGFQLLTLWNHYRTMDWLDLYPIPKNVRQRAITHLLLQLLVVKTFLLGLLIAMAASWQEMVLLWILGGLFTMFFIQFYVKKKLRAS